MTSNAAKPSILVIGAGPSGLAAARALRHFGLDYHQVEQHTDTGGLWDIDNPFTPMYESAHFISSRDRSGFPDRPMPKSFPDYPRRTDLVEYIWGFAADHELQGSIRFGVQVVSVAHRDDGRWDVTTRRAPSGWAPHDQVRTEAAASPETCLVATYDAVICCSGMLHDPIVPELAGEFTGEQLHTRDYRGIDQLRGRRVVVVGAGNSGCDIVCDAAQAAGRAVLSMRRGYWIIPKHIFGIPADMYNATTGVPMRVEQAVFQRLLRLLNGDLTRLGLPRPDHRIFETHPIVNSSLVHALQHGDVVIRPALERADGAMLHFVDGSTEQADLLLWATGYRHSVPYAQEYFGDPQMPDLYLRTFSRTHKGLFGVGFVETNSGAWGFFDAQAWLVANHLNDWTANPGRAQALTGLVAGAEPDLSGGIRFVDSPRHVGYTETHTLEKELDQMFIRMGWWRGSNAPPSRTGRAGSR